MNVTQHGNGRFCWAELHTTDGAGAKAFYSAFLGWEAEDSPMGPDEVYTMFKLNGQTSAAAYQDNSGQAPPHWSVYITVENVDASLEKAKALGGNIIAGPFDVMEHGRMAVVQDPAGAIFCLWQPKAHIGYHVINEAGAVCWNELMTSDPAKAGEFYSSLLGYSLKENTVPVPYTEFKQGEASVAGMMKLPPHMTNVPSHWGVYFAVADCKQSLEKAASLGAEVLMGPHELPEIGTIAVIRDPQGAVFNIIS